MKNRIGLLLALAVAAPSMGQDFGGGFSSYAPAPSLADYNALAAHAASASRTVPPWFSSTLYPSMPGTVPTLAYSGPGGATPITSAVTLPYDTTNVSLLGIVPALKTQFSTNYYTNTVNSTGTPTPFAVEFDYYGADFALRYRDVAGAPMFWVWVDGQPTTSAPVTPATTPSAGSLFRVQVTFATTAWRRIRIYMRLADFGGLEVGPTDTVAPTATTYAKVAWLGDSWTAGTGASDDFQTFAQIATRLLGWGVPFIAGQGGTGYTDDGGGGGKAIYGDSGRKAALVSAAPDVLVVTGSINDVSAGAATIQTAATTALAALHAALPRTHIIVVGVQSPTGSPSADFIATNNAVKAAAAAVGLDFIDPIAGGWITGTGKAGATTGSGNADVFIGSDGVHPTQAGHEFYARRTAQAIVAAGARAGGFF